MTTPWSPLLAALGSADLSKAPYPLLASPKLDGIRCYCHPTLGPVTRALKPIPNDFIRTTLLKLPTTNLDGELMIRKSGKRDVFGDTTSAIMRKKGEPDFVFHTFDNLARGPLVPFEQRTFYTYGLVQDCQSPFVENVNQVYVNTLEEATNYCQKCVEYRHEGAMFRRLDGHYKFGRSTEREAILLRYKPLVTSKAIIVGYEELLHNENTPFLNALGHTERTSHQENLVAGGCLGALKVRLLVEQSERSGADGPAAYEQIGPIFSVGSGPMLTKASRFSLWESRDQLPGRIIEIRFQKYGMKDSPRQPSWICFRDDLLPTLL